MHPLCAGKRPTDQLSLPAHNFRFSQTDSQVIFLPRGWSRVLVSNFCQDEELAFYRQLCGEDILGMNVFGRK